MLHVCTSTSADLWADGWLTTVVPEAEGRGCVLCLLQSLCSAVGMCLDGVE